MWVWWVWISGVVGVVRVNVSVVGVNVGCGGCGCWVGWVWMLGGVGVALDCTKHSSQLILTACAVEIRKVNFRQGVSLGLLNQFSNTSENGWFASIPAMELLMKSTSQLHCVICVTNGLALNLSEGPIPSSLPCLAQL